MVVVSFVFFCPNARGTMSRRIWKRLAFPNTMKSLKTIGEQKSSGNISGNIIALELAWPPAFGVHDDALYKSTAFTFYLLTG